MPGWQTGSAGFNLKIKPVGRRRRSTRKLTEPRRRRHDTQERERFGMVSMKPVQKLRSGAINVIRIDAIEFIGRAALRTRT